MTLYYKDKRGTIHKETVFGYFEQGYYGEAHITLGEINEEGIISVDIEEEMFK